MKKILIASSNPLLLDFCSHGNHLGYEISINANSKGIDVAKALEKSNPDFLILDQIYEDMFGFDVKRELEKQYKTLKIMIIDCGKLELVEQYSNQKDVDVEAISRIFLPVLASCA